MRTPVGSEMLTALRVWAVLVAIAFIGSVGFFFVPVLQGDPGPSTKSLPFLVSPVAAAALFIWGLAAWGTRKAWLARSVAWVMLAGSTFFLIGFTFMLLTLLLTTVPVLWPRQVWSRNRTDSGCRGI